MAVTSKLMITYFQNFFGIPATGLTPTINIWQVTPTTNTLVVNAAAMTEVGDGFYKYNFTSYDSTLKFAARADGGAGNGLGAARFAPAINNSFADDGAFATWQEQISAQTTPGTFGYITKQTHGQLQRSIWIDTGAVTNGDGSQQSPFNNLASAEALAISDNITHFVLLDDLTLDRDMRFYNFKAETNNVEVTLAGFNVGQTWFKGVTLRGSYAGSIDATSCILDNNLGAINGTFHDCALRTGLSVRPGGKIIFNDCYSDIPGLNRPDITISGANTDVGFRRYSGGLVISGMDDASIEVTVEMTAGRLLLDNTNTAGTISVRGNTEFTDNSAGSTVETSGLSEYIVWEAKEANHYNATTMGYVMNIMRRYTENRTLVDPINFTLTVYDDDGTTPIQVFDLKDFAGDPSIDTIAERQPQ